MNVLSAAWTANGSPLVAPSIGEGRCARCTDAGGLVATRSAISKAFTAFDDWNDPSGPGICQACAWMYSTPALRRQPQEITREPSAWRVLERCEAGALLRAGPLPPDTALVVPLRPGRKHLLPRAAWGRVCVDDAQLVWHRHQAELLRLVFRLRGSGFGTRMLTEPAPPFQTLRALPPDRWSRVLDDWQELAVWRTADNPWMSLALHITTPTKERS